MVDGFRPAQEFVSSFRLLSPLFAYFFPGHAKQGRSRPSDGFLGKVAWRRSSRKNLQFKSLLFGGRKRLVLQFARRGMISLQIAGRCLWNCTPSGVFGVARFKQRVSGTKPAWRIC